jgi:hypothetical protein
MKLSHVYKIQGCKSGGRLVFTRGEAGFSEIRGALVLVIQRDQKRCHRNIHLL